MTLSLRTTTPMPTSTTALACQPLSWVCDQLRMQLQPCRHCLLARIACDFSCLYGMTEQGCTDNNACNFLAQEPCNYTSCLALGCNVMGACNYDAQALYNDGSCEYASCAGCTNPSACDYDAEALVSGACDWESCLGCNQPLADNYDADANNAGSGVCVFQGCTFPQACNYNAGQPTTTAAVNSAPVRDV